MTEEQKSEIDELFELEDEVRIRSILLITDFKIGWKSKET